MYRFGAGLLQVKFVPRPFMDDTLIKWMCVADPEDEEYLSCAEEHSIVTEDDTPQFDSQLRGICEGWCCICREPIEPMQSVPPTHEDPWSSALSLELGSFFPSKVGVPLFRPWQQGHIHYFCIEEFNLSLDRLIVTSDCPEWFNASW